MLRQQKSRNTIALLSSPITAAMTFEISCRRQSLSSIHEIQRKTCISLKIALLNWAPAIASVRNTHRSSMSRVMPSLRTDLIYSYGRSKRVKWLMTIIVSSVKGPLIGNTNSENFTYHDTVCTFYRCRKDKGRCDPPFQIHVSTAQ